MKRFLSLVCFLWAAQLGFVACDNAADGDGDGDSDGDSDGDGDGDACEDAECCEDSDCSNGLFCDGVEVCDRGVCEHDPDAVLDTMTGQYRIHCDDGISCTFDLCDERSNLCVHPPDHEACNDDDQCNGIERCDPADTDDLTGCVMGLHMVCDDGDDCTMDYCEDNQCRTRIRDGDGDGFADQDCQICDPENPEDCTRGTDCDDSDETTFPEAEEICDDGRDNNCDRDRDYADPSCTVPNDTCDTALELIDGEVVNSSTRGTSSDVDEACGAPSSRDVVFYFVLFEQSDVTLSIDARTGQDIHVAITADCDTPDVTMACEAGRTFEVGHRALIPGTYFVIVGAASELDFSIELNTAPPEPSQEGDLCDTAQVIESDGSLTSSTTVGFLNDYTFTCFDDEEVVLLDRVYSFDVSTEQTADFTVDVVGGTGTVALALQEACGLSTTERGCWTGETSASGRAWRLMPGSYYLLVGHEAEAELEVSVTLSPLDPGLYLAEDFSGSPSGWIINGAWSQGTPSGAGGEPEPDSGGCIAASMGGSYPVGMTYSNDYAQTPAIDLRGAAAPTLQFRSWLQTNTYSTGGHVEASNDPEGPWTVVDNEGISPAYDGNMGSASVWWGERSSWSDFEVDLSEYIDEVIYIRFSMYSDIWDYAPRQGWYIDSVMVIDP